MNAEQLKQQLAAAEAEGARQREQGAQSTAQVASLQSQVRPGSSRSFLQAFAGFLCCRSQESAQRMIIRVHLHCTPNEHVRAVLGHLYQLVICCELHMFMLQLRNLSAWVLSQCRAPRVQIAGDVHCCLVLTGAAVVKQPAALTRLQFLSALAAPAQRQSA